MVKVERKTWQTVRILEWYESISSGKEYSVVEQYEFLANLIAAYGGRIHGSQSHGDGSSITITVYFELPIENKEEFLKEEKQ